MTNQKTSQKQAQNSRLIEALYEQRENVKPLEVYMDKDLEKLMEKYNVPCKVKKVKKQTLDLNPQDKVIDCDYVDPAGFPHWDKD